MSERDDVTITITSADLARLHAARARAGLEQASDYAVAQYALSRGIELELSDLEWLRRGAA